MIEDEFDKSMKNIKEQLIYRIKRQEQEIERLHSIIKEVREYIEENKSGFYNNLLSDVEFNVNELLEILDKVEENSK